MSDPRIQAMADAEPPAEISQDAAKMLFVALNYLQACVRNPSEDVFQSGALEAADEALARARDKPRSAPAVLEPSAKR